MGSYTQRLNALQPTRTWHVNATGLHWSDDRDGASQIPWNMVQSVRLRYEPSRAETRRIALHIYTPMDHVITNIHYKGVMDFVAQEEAFRTFVKAFHRHVPKDGSIEFHLGSTPVAFVSNALITLAVLILLFLLAPLLAVTGIPGAGAIFRILLILVFMPTLWRLFRRNRPRPYDPDALPVDMLG